MNALEKKCRQLLLQDNIDSDSEIDFDVNGKIHTLSYTYIIETFMQASTESQLVFVAALQKALEAGETGVSKFFQGMGQLLLMTHLSEKLEA
ncbi:MAG: hypothetical protein FP820_09270 [Sulfurimonas sp.]|jgi:hypothetical protein|nr:hypothetical protein [Sulfurimonas sp.]MBU1216438.1 hypothetical protein [bacterium]MBU1433447.1 hypothetical protein [bacterium]MBU1503371.1 hypothetical protein [bacterium]MBU3938303.1 hypothetical protein [bacterium]